MSCTPQAATKIVDLEGLAALRHRCRAMGKTVVWTNGCFDLLHVGHAQSLQQASELGDVLVVGVNSDRSVQALKGPSRPVVPERDRAELVAALGCVDHVIIFDEQTPARILAQIQPDIHCKGSEYAPPDGRPIPEAEIIYGYGGRIEFLELKPAISTTDLIARIGRSETKRPHNFNGGDDQ